MLAVICVSSDGRNGICHYIFDSCFHGKDSLYREMAKENPFRLNSQPYFTTVTTILLLSI